MAGQRIFEWDGKFAYSRKDEDAKFFLSMGFGSKTHLGLRLHPLEAAYLLEKKKISLVKGKKKISQKDVLKAKGGKNTPSLKDQYAIFKQFRSGGHVVRFTPSSPLHWRVLARGVGREQDRAQTLVQVVTPSWCANISSLETSLRTARLMRLSLAIAYVEGGKPYMVKLSKPSIEV